MLVAFACLQASNRIDGKAEDVRVDASLTVSAELPERARHVLVHEAETIWREAGVRIRWVEGAEESGDGPALLILVVRHADGRSPEGEAVGELVRTRSGRAIAFASIARAEQVVRAAGTGAVQAAPVAVRDRRLGMVLGRTVAHEIGHYLLESSTHTGRGLMRATFQPREFSDPRQTARCCR
jgi:hypothetical protein